MRVKGNESVEKLERMVRPRKKVYPGQECKRVMDAYRKALEEVVRGTDAYRVQYEVGPVQIFFSDSFVPALIPRLTSVLVQKKYHPEFINLRNSWILTLW